MNLSDNANRMIKMAKRAPKEDLGNDNCLTDDVRIGGCKRWQGHLLKEVAIRRDAP
jgi:hypothetical protein